MVVERFSACTALQRNNGSHDFCRLTRLGSARFGSARPGSAVGRETASEAEHAEFFWRETASLEPQARPGVLFPRRRLRLASTRPCPLRRGSESPSACCQSADGPRKGPRQDRGTRRDLFSGPCLASRSCLVFTSRAARDGTFSRWSAQNRERCAGRRDRLPCSSPRGTGRKDPVPGPAQYWAGRGTSDGILRVGH